MTRLRATVLFLCIAAAEFVFEQVQRRLDAQSEVASTVLILLIVISLLTLVLSTRFIVVYGMFVLVVIVITAGIDGFNASLSGAAKIVSLAGGMSIASALFVVLRNIHRATWIQNRRYISMSNDPWVSLDKGIDPTIESGKEGS